MSQNLTNIQQTHSGRGDNIAGDKHITNTAVRPEQVSILVEEAFDYLLLLELESAQKTLNSLKKLKETSVEVSESIELLEIFLQINRHQNNIEGLPEDHINFVKSKLSSEANSSLANALLLKYLSLKAPKEALAFYNDITNKKHKFIKSIFIQHIATEAELQSYVNKYSTLSSTERHNLGFGVGFRGTAQQASQLGELLAKEQESSKQLFFSFWLKQKALFARFCATPYLLISYDDKESVDSFVDECTQLLGNDNGDWKFILNIVVPLFNYIGYENTVFLEQCRNYQDDIKKNYPEVWHSIACSFDGFEVTADDGLPFNIKQERKDENFKKELLKKIQAQETWTIDDVDYVLAFGKPHIIQPDAVSITGEDKKLIEFTRLKIRLLQIDDERTLKEREEVLTAIQVQQETIKNLSPFSLLSICTALEQKREYKLIQHLLYPLLVDRTDLWLSPITSLYLVALYQNNQYKTLEKVKAQISSKENKRLIYELESHLAYENGDFDKAANLICEALKVDKLNLNAWAFFSNLVVSGYSNDSDGKIFDLLDKSFFEEIVDEHLIFLIALVKSGYVQFVEEVLVSYFTKNTLPDYSIVPRFFAGLAIHSVEFSPSEIVNDCIGIEYSKSGRHCKSIIVPDKDVNNHCISRLEPYVDELVRLTPNTLSFLSDNIDYNLFKKNPSSDNH